jgi:hypothetical protein
MKIHNKNVKQNNKATKPKTGIGPHARISARIRISDSIILSTTYMEVNFFIGSFITFASLLSSSNDELEMLMSDCTG